VVTY